MVDINVPPVETHYPPSSNVYPLITRSKVGIVKPMIFFSVYAGVPIEPSTYKQATKVPEWQQAMNLLPCSGIILDIWFHLPPLVL